MAEHPGRSSAQRRNGKRRCGDARRRTDRSRHGVMGLIREASVRPERLERTATRRKAAHMRGILLWLVGIPIPIIILLYLFNIL